MSFELLGDPKFNLLSHALALDERRVNFRPHFYDPPAPRDSPSINPPTKIYERWFVGDHSDVGGRFSFEELANRPALANPPFRWIVWGAVHAAGHRTLLFNNRAFTKYFSILIYAGKVPSPNKGPTDYHAQNIIGVRYFHESSPVKDSGDAERGPENGRPLRELRDTSLRVNNVFTTPSIWIPMQLLRGRGLHGNARDIKKAIPHASIQGRFIEDLNYGGKRRTELEQQLVNADEAMYTSIGDVGRISTA